MLNISKHHKAIVSCSAIVAAIAIGSAQSAMAQTAPTGTTNNGSNASGGNVTTTNGGGVPTTTGGSPAPNPGIVSRATAINNNLSVAQANYSQAATALAQAQAAQPTVADTTPVRYGREVADLASCGCPNADTVSNNATSPRPELVAAKAAEAEAATQLANAKAEARQFIESVKGDNNAGQAVVSQLW